MITMITLSNLALIRLSWSFVFESCVFCNCCWTIFNPFLNNCNAVEYIPFSLNTRNWSNIFSYWGTFCDAILSTRLATVATFPTELFMLCFTTTKTPKALNSKLQKDVLRLKHSSNWWYNKRGERYLVSGYWEWL